MEKRIFKILLSTAVLATAQLNFSGCTDMSGDGIDTIIWEGSDNPESTNYRNPVWEPSLEGGTVVATPTNFVAIGAETQWAVGVDYCCPSLYSSSAMIWETNHQESFSTANRPKWIAGRINSISVDYCTIKSADGGKSASRYIMLYSTDKDNSIGVSSAASAQGPYVDHGCFLKASDVNASSLNDPFILAADVDEFYVGYTTNNGSYVQKISFPYTQSATAISFNTSVLPTLEGDAAKISGASFTNIALFKESDDLFFIFGDVNGEIRYATSTSATGTYYSENSALISSNGSAFAQDGSEYKNPKNVMRILKSTNGYYYAAYNATMESNATMPSGYERCPMFLTPFQVKNGAIDSVIKPEIGWTSPKYQ